MKSLSRSLETSPNMLFLNWVVRVAWTEFIKVVDLTKEAKCDGNLKISLITVSHTASCNLRNVSRRKKISLETIPNLLFFA